MNIARAAISLADRPISVLVAIVAAMGIVLIAPSADRAIPILRDVETSVPIWIDADRLGWKVGLCRSRGGPAFTGIQFDVYPASGAHPFPLRGVMDLDAEVYAGSEPQQLKRGACRTYSYAASLTGQAVTGDTIAGTAVYQSSVGWWTLWANYGSVVVPAPPDVVRIEDRIIQRQLEAVGQGLEEFRK